MKNINKKFLYVFYAVAIAFFIGGCVSQKKYQLALDEIARMRVDSSLQATKLANIDYDKTKQLMAARSEILHKTTQLDSIRSLAKTRKQKLDELSHSLHAAIPTLDKENLDTYMEGGYLHVALAHRLLFNTGEDELTDDGNEVIKQIAQTLKDVNTDIMILGHTDSVPYVSSNKNNWELSLERSHAVMQALVDNGMSQKNFIIAGRSQYDPMLDNESQIGRLLNRRIDLILVPKIDEMESLIEKVSDYSGI